MSPTETGLSHAHARASEALSPPSGPTMRYRFGTLTLTPRAHELVQQVMASGRLSCGRLVRQFEERFAELVGVRHAVAVSSGTEADALALAVLYDYGARRGDEVIVPAHSFAATGNAVLQAGFTPVFVDVDPESLCIDPDRIEAAVSERTRAILPVHLMGKAAAMDRIREIARRHDLVVVADAAEAHGSQFRGRDVAQWADMTTYSLYVAHIISTVEGGIVATDRDDYAEILRSLRSHGRFCKCATCVVNRADASCARRQQNGRDMRFVFERIGFSCKMNELEAAIGLGNLDCYDEILAVRRRHLLSLIERFEAFAPWLWTIREEPTERIGPHAFPIVVRPEAPFTRDALMAALARGGIDSRDLFSCMATQCPGFAFLGYRLGDFPHSERLGTNGLHVGVHQDLSEADLEALCRTVEQFIREHV